MALTKNVRSYLLVILGCVAIVSVLYRVFVYSPMVVKDKSNRDLIIAEYERDNAIEKARLTQVRLDSMARVTDSILDAWERGRDRFENDITAIKRDRDAKRIINSNSTTDERISVLSEWFKERDSISDKD